MDLPKIEIPALRADGTTQHIVVPAGERAGVLIVDDTPAKLVALGAIVSGMALEIVTASSGEQALRQLLKRDFAVILLDVNMPTMDGFETATLIRSRPRSEHTPIIFVTAEANSDTARISGYTLGAVDFIYSPIIPEILRAKVRVFVNLYTIQRQLLLHTEELEARQQELANSNQALNGLYRVAEGLSRAVSEREVVETALEMALELPRVQAGWISLREGESGFRLAATRNLPPALEAPGALEGDCLCRRKLLAGELGAVNILECERLDKTKGDTRGLRYHASVPLWHGDRTLGVMNLAGPQEGAFKENELKVLHGIGHQIAVALERARLHDKLNDSEMMSRSLTEGMVEGMITTTTENIVLEANAAALQLFGYEKSDLIGRDASELVPERHRRHYKDTMAALRAQPDSVRIPSRVLRSVRKDGSEFTASLSFASVQVGGRRLFTGMILDITESKRLAEAQARLIGILDATPDFVATTDADQRVTYLNPTAKQLLGIAKGEDTSQVKISSSHPEWAAKLVLEVGLPTAIRDGTWSGDTAFIDRDGREVPMSQTIIAHKDAGGAVEYLSTIGRNMTERKRTEAALQQELIRHQETERELFDARVLLAETDRQEAVGRLAAGVAHEVKNPLAIIRLGIDYLSKEFAPESTQGAVLGKIQQATVRADSIVTDLMQFSRQKSLARHPTQINAVIDNAINLVSHEITVRNIDIVRSYDDSMPPILADPDQLAQVFVNLLSNAAQAIGRGGRIKVVTRSIRLSERDLEQDKTGTFRIGERVITVEIKDNGPGVSSEHEKRLFEPFFTTKSIGEGTGLGLAVSRNIVIMHEGSINLANRPEGGASALLMFPVDRGVSANEAADTGGG